MTTMNSPGPRRRRVILISALLVFLGLGAAILWPVPLSGRPVVLKFLAYTNNAYTRVALFEITNQSAADFRWSLHADGRELFHRVAVTELMETNGELRHIGSGGPMNLFRHDSLEFATDELSPGERVWIEIRPYPESRAGRLRNQIAGWLQQRGWISAAFHLKPGTRVEGTLLPAGGK